MAMYAPPDPQPTKRRRPPLFTRDMFQMLGICWAGVFVVGILAMLLDLSLPDGPACGRLALTSLLFCVLHGLGQRYQPRRRALRVLAGVAVGFPLGVVTLGILMPLELWPPAAPLWWIFGLLFSVVYAWSVFNPK